MVGQTLAELGFVRLAAGKPDEARKCYAEAVAEYEKTKFENMQPRERQEYLDVLGRFSNVLRDLRDFDGATKLLEKKLILLRSK